MADSKPINWAYPFKTAGEASKEVSDPQLYFDALAKAENGFYPMGANGLWHGGVHFDAGTGALLDQSEVRCIADGEVIAYRIDDKYPETQYALIKPGSGPESIEAKYSTGFVLVKHWLKLPPAPPPATPADATATAATSTATATATATAPVAAAAPTPAAEPEGLTFYSLYMHLLDWKGYQAQPTLKRPGFWGAGLYKVKADAPDKVLGLNVRDYHKVAQTDDAYAKYQNKLTTLPRGTTIETGEAAPSPNQNWRKLVRVTPAVAGLAENTGWVYVPEAKKLAENHYLVTEKDSKDVPALEQIGLHVREAANGSSNVLAVLPRGTEIKVSREGASGKYLKLESIISGNAVPPLTADAAGKLPGYVWLDSLESQQTPNALAKEAVYPLPTAYPIKAGELIGHLGQYQNHDDSTPKALLHLEVFSCEDVPAFIAKSRARASSLPVEQKTLLKIHKGASKLIPHGEGINASNPPKITDEGVKVGVDLIIPVSVLENLPADRKIKVSETLPGSPTPRITQWWRLDSLLADEAGNPIGGWLADIIPTRHSPWEWEGFGFISETVCAADQFACHLDAQRLLSEVGQADYQAQISTADHGPVKARLYDIIDGADGTTHDDKLSTTEIRAALAKPWHAQSISQLITHYESEWFWKAAKWDELDKLMEHTPADPNPNWVSEKKRIQTLSWWSEINLNPDGKAWHLNAAALIGNFSSKGCVCLDDLTKAQLKAIAPGASTANVDRYISPINEMFRTFGIESCISRAHVLAQMLHESGSMNFVTEGLNSDNPLPSYHPYIGRGLIQITWEANYRAYGNYIGESFIGSPHYNKMAESPHCVTSVGWFWTQFKKLLNHSDSDDFIYVTALINGGFNGYDHRLEFLNSAIEQLKIRFCAKLNTAGVYKFDDSEAYNKAKFSFAWGLWSDPGSTSRGKEKNTPDAIAGYSRFLEIYESSQRVRDDNTTTYYASSRKAPQAKDHAERRIEALRSS